MIFTKKKKKKSPKKGIYNKKRNVFYSSKKSRDKFLCHNFIIILKWAIMSDREKVMDKCMVLIFELEKFKIFEVGFSEQLHQCF